jgi:hypothetical protein
MGVVTIIAGLVALFFGRFRKLVDEFVAAIGPAAIRVIAALALGYSVVFIYAVTQ